MNGEIVIKELKIDERPVRSLNDTQIKNLLEAAQPHQSMKIRILLALGTGLRRGDIESLKISDIDFEKNCIATTSRKARKSMGARPVPTVIMQELKKYLNSSHSDQQRLFIDKFNYKRWKKTCGKANLYNLKFHDLRKTFGSLLAQNGVSTAVIQKLLEHSSPILTNKIYTNIYPVLRQSVNQLPIENGCTKHKAQTLQYRNLLGII